MKLEVEWV